MFFLVQADVTLVRTKEELNGEEPYAAEGKEKKKEK